MGQHLDRPSVGPVVLGQPADVPTNGIPAPAEVLLGNACRRCVCPAAEVSAKPVNDGPGYVVVASTSSQSHGREPEDSASQPAIVPLMREPQRHCHRTVGLTTPVGKPLYREDACQRKEPLRGWNTVCLAPISQRPFCRAETFGELGHGKGTETEVQCVTQCLGSEGMCGLPDAFSQAKHALYVDVSENGGVNCVQLVVNAGPKVGCQSDSRSIDSPIQVVVERGEAYDRGAKGPGVGSRFGPSLEWAAGTVEGVNQGGRSGVAIS